MILIACSFRIEFQEFDWNSIVNVVGILALIMDCRQSNLRSANVPKA